MSRSVICPACGQRLEVGDDYRRNKVQCGCGVFCELPARPAGGEVFPEPPRRSPPPAPPPEEAAPRPRPAAPRPAAPTAPVPPPPSRGARAIVTCPHCGELVRPAKVGRGRSRQCPNCGSTFPRPADASDPVPPPPPPLPVPQVLGDRVPVAEDSDLLVRLSQETARPAVPPPAADDEDDGRPYVFVDTGEQTCPGCGKLLDPGVVECPRCEFDLEVGRKLDKVYAPLSYRWDSGIAPAKRRAMFLTGVAVMGGLSLVAAWTHQSLFIIVGPLLVYMLLTSFLLGTWSRLDLARDRKGKVRLTQTWYCCFIPLSPTPIRVYTYEGVATGTDHEAGCWEWWVFFNLLPFLLIPGLLWWYYAIRRDVFYVALTKDHGFPERMIYRGWDDDRMREIAATLRDVAEMPWEQGANL